MDLILKPFAWLLVLIYNLVNNYGVALFLFAILVKVILFPFSMKGKKGMVKMSMLTAETKKLEKLYGLNTPRYNQELQNLYEREGVNPMSGCLWSMLPLFVLIPLYSIIRQPLKYMMGLSAEQISAVAKALNWGQVSIDMGWVKNATDAASNLYNTGVYNELYLASLIKAENLDMVRAVAGEGGNILAMNFNFLGLDLSQIPTWQFWSNGMDWGTIGLFLMVITSALIGFISTKVSMATNKMNGATDDANDPVNKSAASMVWMTPLMSLWIGFMMPGLLNVYWIANSLLTMVQEKIAGSILKKDYEECRRIEAENALRAKEEEKTRKRELAEKRAKEKEEAKKNKVKQPKEEEKKDNVVIGVSRVGMRAYARGRAYDPNRYGGVTPYFDPDLAFKKESEKTSEEVVEETKADE